MSSFYLSDLSERDRPWDNHRHTADRIRDLYQGTPCEAYAEKIANCSKLLFMKLGRLDDGERRFKLERTQFCRVRHCPVCQWRRSLTWIARFHAALPRLRADYPKARYIFLTLTIRNCLIQDLRSSISHLNDGFRRLSKRKCFPGLGYIKSVEVTRAYDCYYKTQYLGRHGLTWVKNWQRENSGKEVRLVPTDESHPHCHVLMMVSPGYFSGQGYINQQEWRELWRDSLRVSYDPWVYVETVKPKKSSPVGDNGLIDAVREAMKYTVKGEDLVADQDWLIELTYQLHGTRALSVGGVLKNYLSEEEPTVPEMTHAGYEDVTTQKGDPKWIFGWREEERRYKGNERR